MSVYEIHIPQIVGWSEDTKPSGKNVVPEILRFCPKRKQTIGRANVEKVYW